MRRPNGVGGHIWNGKGVERVIYRLPELLQADCDEWVFVCEGEKDVDTLRSIGLTATTNPGGALKWKHIDGSPLHERKLAILPDNDQLGIDHAEDVAQRQHQISSEIRIVQLPGLRDKGDVSDWLSNGGNKDALLKIVGQTGPWKPPEQPSLDEQIRNPEPHP